MMDRALRLVLPDCPTKTATTRLPYRFPSPPSGWFWDLMRFKTTAEKGEKIDKTWGVLGVLL